VNLLRKAGVKADPILFSTRDNGLASSSFPFLSQFNTVMAYVLSEDRFYILDATSRYGGYDLVPEPVVNTMGFVVEGEKGKWIEVADQKNKYKVFSAVHAIIDGNGIMKGDCMVNCSGYAKTQRCRKWARDKEKFKESYFTVPNARVKLDELTVSNAEVDSMPLEQKASFTYTINSSGEYRNFTVNIFSDMDTNPFIADERKSDVDFGFLQDYTLFGNYTIPEGYTFESVPKSMSLIMPDTSIVFKRIMQAEDNLLDVRVWVNFKQSYYTAASYPVFANFYKQFMTLLNEPVVIKKKTAP
jgi:hypothetical protein